MNGHASLNRFYRLVWSHVTQSWHAVSELTKSNGKGGSRSLVLSTIASVVLAGGSFKLYAQQAPPATQLPTGGIVAQGTASIAQTATAQAARMTVNQSSQRAVINWNSFNVGQNASVVFNQPNAQAVTLNRITDQNPSQIYGQVQANGQVFLTNPNGVYFSPTSQVDVGALVATTHSISDNDFMAGNNVFSRNGATGSVVNDGKLNAALGGYIALLAPEVRNSGVVIAQAGTVALAAGEVITLNINGSGGMLGISTTPSTIASLIENKQAVQAPDGQIILSAVALSKLQAGVIKNSGSLEANSISNKGGVITLEGDDITLSSTSRISATGATGGGTVLVGGDWQGSGSLRQATHVAMDAGASIDASATQQGDGGKVVLWSDVHNADSATSVAGNIRTVGGTQGGYGGQIETSGHYLKVDPAVSIAAGAANATGTKGLWLLDPTDVTIVDGSQQSLLGDMLLSGDWSTPYAYLQSKSYSTMGAITGTTIDVAVIANTLRSGSPTTVMSITTSNMSGTGTGNIIIDTGITLNIPASSTLNLIADGGLTGSGSINLATGANLLIKQSGNSTYSGAITGTGSVQKQGAGTLTLSSANSSFTGNLSFSSLNGNPGTIKVGDVGTTTTGPLGGVGGSRMVMGDGSATPGVLDLNGFSLLTPVSLSTLQLTNSANSAVSYSGNVMGNPMGMVTVTNALGSDITMSGMLTGSGALKKYGAGTLTLSGANAYTGASNVYEGNLEVTGTLRDSAVVNVSSGAAYKVSNTDTIGAISGSGSVVIGSGYTLSLNVGGLNAGNPFNFSGVISGAGALTKLGAQPHILSGANTYTGATTINAGTLNVTGSLADTTAVTVASGATYAVNASDTIGSLAGAGFVTLAAGQTLTKGDNTSAIFSGVMSGAGAFNVAGGTEIFTGANTYTGGTTIDTGATLQIGNGSTTGAIAGAIVDNGTLTFNLSSSLTFTNDISGSGSIHNDGPGSTLLTGALTNSGTNVVNAGALCIGACPVSFNISSQTTQAEVQAVTQLQITGLTVSEVQGLTSSQMGYLTASQVGYFSTTQLAAMSTSQIAGLSTTQLAGVTASQMAAMTTAQVAAMTTAQVAALSSTQMGAVTASQMAAMTTAQVAAMTTAQVAALSRTQMGAVTASQMAAMTTAQVAAMTTSQVAALSSTQMGAVTATQMAAMTTAQVAAMTTAQVAALSSTQMGAVTASQIAAMTTAQVAAMTVSQLGALTSAQAAALTSSQLSALSSSQQAAVTSASSNNSNSSNSSNNSNNSSNSNSSSSSSVSSSTTPAQIQNLSNSQAAQLTVNQLSGLSPTQLMAFTPSQQAAMLAANPVAAALFSPSNPSNPATVGGALTTAVSTGRSTSSQGAQSSQSVTAPNAVVPTLAGSAPAPSAIMGMSGSQMSGMSVSSVQAISPTSLSVLSGAQVAGFTPAQVSGLTPAQVQAFTPTQVQSLTQNQVSAMSANQLSAMSPAQVQSMSVQQMEALSPAQAQAVMSSNGSALSPAQRTTLVAAGNATSGVSTDASGSTTASTAANEASSGAAMFASSSGSTSGAASSVSSANGAAIAANGGSVASAVNANGSSLDGAGTAVNGGGSTPDSATPVASANGSVSAGATTSANTAGVTTGGAAASVTNTVSTTSGPATTSVVSANSSGVTSATTSVATNGTGTNASTGNVTTLTAATQVQSLKPAEIRQLTPMQISSMTPAQVQTLSAKQIATLSPTQVQSLDATQVQSLQPQQLSGLPIKQVAAFSPDQLSTMNRQQAVALMRSRANTLNTSQSSFTPEQRAAVNKVLSAEVTTTNATTSAATNGVLPVTVVGSAATPGLAVRFDGQNAAAIKLQMAESPVNTTVSAAGLNARYTTVEARNANNDVVTFKAAIVKDRLVINTGTAAAKQMARTELPSLMSNAIDTLSAGSTIAVDSLKGIVLNMR